MPASARPDEGGNSDNPNEEEGDEEEQSTRRNRLSASLRNGRRKRKKNDTLDPYRKFAAFYTRSENPFVNYYAVLDTGMAWDTSEFGELTRDQFRAENGSLLQVYKQLRSAVSYFTRDFYELKNNPEDMEGLGKCMNDAVTAARGADISSLSEKGIYYIELEQKEGLIPKLDPAAPKTSTRGHNHPVLSRLLCPVRYLAEFDAEPAEFQRKLCNNRVRVTAADFPSLLYPDNGFDPDDPENGLFRSPILVRFYKHIFTGPSSAKQE